LEKSEGGAWLLSLGGQRTLPPMTVEELRAEATKLPPSERTQLAHSLLLEEQLESWNLTRLRAEIQVGVDELARGEAQTFNSDDPAISSSKLNRSSPGTLDLIDDGADTSVSGAR
jgi:hypothetical protein